MNQRQFTYAADDVPIAWFINNSPEHRKKLHLSMQNIAHVAIKKNSLNKPEFVFSQLEGCNIYPTEFEKKCRVRLKTFLLQYTTKREYFEKEFLDRQPQTFFRVQSKDEDHILYVRWYKDAKHVLICGEILKVEQKLNEIKQQIPTMSNPSISNMINSIIVKIEVPDRHVAMFIKSSDHMERMKQHFKTIAEVQVKITDKDTMEYQFIPNHTRQGFKKDVFEHKCSVSLKKFLENYDTQILKFNENTLSEAHKNNPDYFKSQTPEEKTKIFVSWHPNNVVISGPKIMVQEKVNEVNKLIELKRKEEGKAFVKPINNKQVGMFIKKSPKHKENLDKLFSDFAIVSISENSDRKMEFRCLQKGNGMLQNNFEEMCIDLLSKFENLYKTEQLEFEKGELSNSTLPISYFNPSVGDQQKIFVRWFKDNEQVLVCGPINAVDQKILQITQQFGKGTRKPGKENKLDKQNKNLTSKTEQEQNCPKYKCRILIICDILKKINGSFKGRVQVRCFPDEEKILYLGLLDDIEIAKKDIVSQENALVHQIPTIANASNQFLQVMLKNNKVDMEERIYNLFKKKGIKCVVHMEDGEMTLIASNKTQIKTACDALSALVKTNMVDIPKELSSSALNSEWSNFMKRHITLNSLWAVQEDQCIRICGLQAPPLFSAEDELNKLFERILKKSIVFRCSKARALVIETHRSDDQGCYPISTTFKAVSEGIEITGPKNDVLKVKEYLSNQKWKSDKLQFSAPNIANHFGTDQWKKTCKFLISEYRCAVLSEKTEIAKNKKSASSPVNRITPAISTGQSTSKCKYDDIEVEVCHGDITEQDTDAIVNGCTNDFNLSSGELSPRILNCAGSLIQNELQKADGDSCRITNAYKLPCRKVVHMATPNSEEKLSQRILDSLLLADRNRCRSVALPTLGAGGIGLDVFNVSRAISTAFINFASGSPKKVKTIKLVVFDESVLSFFRNYILSQGISLYGCTNKETILSDLENQINSFNTTSEIEIISDVPMNLNEGRQFLQATLESNFPLHTVSDDSIEKLEVNDKIDIFQNAVNLNSVVTFKLRTISIHGCLEVKDFVFKVISDLKESLQLLKTCKWEMVGCNESLPSRVGLAIERRYKTNQKATFQVDLFGEPSHVDLSKMTILVGTSSNSRKLQRTTNEAIELPPRWDLQLGHRVVLSSSSEEYAAVLSKFQRGNGGPNSIVHQIERIQNEDPYRQFKIKENNVRRSMVSDQPVLRELFHGTSCEDVDKIINEGFNRSFSGKNATAYGRGVYFATTSSYSVRYAKPDVTGRRRMFLADVVTGDFIGGDSSMKKPPMKNSRISYDSVVDNIAHPSIFVVFNDTSVYPSYLITFH